MIYLMSNEGDCGDNAPAESWFGSFKNGAIFGNRFTTHTSMKATCFDYIEVFYHPVRRHIYNNDISPAVFEKQRQESLVSV